MIYEDVVTKACMVLSFMIIYDMIYVGFHAKCISVQMWPSEIEHMYIITARLHMMTFGTCFTAFFFGKLCFTT